MTIFGYKPSEIRKSTVAFLSAVLVLAVALPVAGLPVGVAAAIAGGVGVVQLVVVYLTRNDVAGVIDSVDNLSLGR